MTTAALVFLAIVSGVIVGAEYFCWRTGREVRKLQRRSRESMDRAIAKLKEIK